MLLRFRCKNFRSIRDEQEISFVAAKTRSDERPGCLIDTPFDGLKLLRCLAIYGANASGKSNVLDAFASFRRIVADSWRRWKPNGPIPAYDPFLLDAASREASTEFEIAFRLEADIFRYGFSFDRNRIIEEVLVNTTKAEKVLFHRTPDGGVRFPNKNLGKNAEDRRHIESIKLDVRPNSLFLSAAAQKAHPLLSVVYSHLSDSFRPVHWKNIEDRLRYTATMCGRDETREKILSMLRFADYGIVSMEQLEREIPQSEKRRLGAFMEALRKIEPDSIPDGLKSEIEFPAIPEIRMSHVGEGGDKYPLDKSKESDGTQAYLSYLGPLLDTLQSGALLMIDELETSLHPKLQRELVRIFNSPELNPNGSQFLFTTHNTNLLDLDLLRRDQIWFTEKSREGVTRIRPLTDYQPRTNQNIEAGYLGGRFGAIPNLDDDLLREILTAGRSPQAPLDFPKEN